MDYVPLGKLIVATPIQQEEVSEGGIFIPEQARKTFNEAVVFLCGPEVDDKIQPGHTIVFEQHSETKVKIEGEHYVCVSFDNVLLYKPTKVATTQNAEPAWSEDDSVRGG